ncbi:MAG: Npt1/Npt2 family nucleotide transporter [Acidobacteriota bacterium]
MQSQHNRKPRGATQEAHDSWLSALSVDLRAGEADLCWLLFAIHFLLLTFQYTAKALRQSIFIDALGADRLPFVYLLIALCSYPLLVLHGRMVDRWDQNRLIAGSCLAVGASLIVFWWLFASGSEIVSVAFYLWISIVGILLVSQFWSYASHLLDARQAKRLFGFIGAGGILGSIAGGQLARWASSRLDTYTTLLLAAAVLAALAILMHWRAPRDSAVGPQPPEDDEAPSLADASAGFDVVRQSPYLRLIAAIMLLSGMVAQVVDLQFSWAIEQSTETLEERTAVFGNLYSVMGLCAFAFQLLATARIHRRRGVGYALRILPSTNGVGSIAFLVAGLFFPAFLLPVAWVLKIGENGLRYSLEQSTRELLFLPLPAKQRPKAKAFIDVFVQRSAKGVAALALLSVAFGWMSVVQTAWLSLVWVVLWLALVRSTHRLYVASFRDSLLRRAEPDIEVDVFDRATLEVLIEGLGSADPRETLHSMELLTVHGRGHLVPPLMLHHEAPEIRAKTLEILQAEERRDAMPLVEKLLSDPSARVRAAATRALAALTRRDLRDQMLERLGDPDVRIRSAAVSYLAQRTDSEARSSADICCAELLADGDPEVRLEAARALGEIDDPHYQAGLVQLLYDSDSAVARAAVESVSRRFERGNLNPLYVPILISRLHDRRLKHEARNALVAYGRAAIPSLQHFMNDGSEEIWVRRALPKTMARIGGSTALDALTESLTAADPFLRRKVIEALGTLAARDPDLRPRREPIEAQIIVECAGHLRALIDLKQLRHGPATGGTGRLPRLGTIAVTAGPNGGPHLLERLLADRMDDHSRNIFQLLGLIHPQRDIRATYQGLLSERPDRRAHALEYLDNLLEGEVRQAVFAVIDDLPVRERRRLAKKLFDLAPESRAKTLGRLASERPRGDADAAWVTAAALHYIHDFQISSLYPAIRQAADNDAEPLVQETTELLLSRM